MYHGIGDFSVYYQGNTAKIGVFPSKIRLINYL